MNYRNLMRDRLEKQIKPLRESKPKTFVLDAHVYNGGEQDINPNVLYILPAQSEALASLAGQQLSVLLCGPLGDSAVYDGFANVYHAPEDEPLALAEILLAHLREEQIYMQKSTRMTDALLSNNGLQYLLDEACEVFGNPIMVVDSAYRYIAVSTGELEEDSQFANTLREEMAQGYVLEEGIQYIRRTGLDRITRELSEPYDMENEVLGARVYIASVRVHNVDVAHLTLVEHSRPVTETDIRCMVVLQGLIAQEMQKNAFYASNKGQMYSYLLNDMLDSEQPDYAGIKKRLAMLNYRLGEAFYIVVIHGRKFEEPTCGLDYVTEQLSPILTGNIYARYQGSLVLFINQKKRDDIGDYILKSLEDIAAKTRYSIGISNAYYDIVDTRRCYHQALRATVFSELNGDQSPLCYYMDYTVQDLLNIGKGSRNLLELCHPGIFKLMEYDKQNNAQLAHTLYYYLEIPHTPQLIAEKLHIHRNTFFYRLEKIRDILQSDLKGGRELFLFHFSFVVLHFLGKFNPTPHEE